MTARFKTFPQTVSSTEDPLVVCHGVGRTFGRGHSAVVAIHEASCCVEDVGQIALIGRSGSGKSTLLHLLGGLDTPTRGTISWPALAGKPLRPGPIGIVFQAPSLLPALDVAENVALPLLLAGVGADSARTAAQRALRAMRLHDLAGRLPDELSGGQAQRVAIARAMVGEPQLVLADEPTGQLDRETARVVIDALLEGAERVGAALIVATHDESIAERFETIWHVSDGRLATRATTRC